MLFDDLARLELKSTSAQHERAYLIETLLADAGAASLAKVGPRKWWWGTEIERAWARLREVEERTVDVLPDTELLARGTDALAKGEFYLKSDDKRRQRLQRLLEQVSKTATSGSSCAVRPIRGLLRKSHATVLTAPSMSDLRSCIVDVLRASHAKADQNNQQARYLRNRLIVASLVSLVFAVVIVFAQWLLHERIKLLSPPGDWHGAAWSYLLVVMFFGAVGALITAIPVMSKIPLDYGPFNLPLQQTLLKLFVGPLVAVIGLLALGANVLEFGKPTDLAGVLLLALLFGAGQQAVTRYVDQRASEILTGATGSASK